MQNGPMPGGPAFEPEKYIGKIFKNLLRTTRLRCLKLGIKHCLLVLYQVCSNECLSVQNGPALGGPGFEQ